MKRFIAIVVLLVLICQFSFAQGLRMGSCSSMSAADRIYFTAYSGFGVGRYMFDDASVMPSEGTRWKTRPLFSLPVGASLHYRFDYFNLGLGFTMHQLTGKHDANYVSSNAQVEERVKLMLYKFYASLEIPFYSSSFFDVGWGANAGSFLADGYIGKDAKSAFYFETGPYYNLILNSYSSLIFKLQYGKSFFETTITQAVSKQKVNDLTLQLGWRIWF